MNIRLTLFVTFLFCNNLLANKIWIDAILTTEDHEILYGEVFVDENKDKISNKYDLQWSMTFKSESGIISEINPQKFLEVYLKYSFNETAKYISVNTDNDLFSLYGPPKGKYMFLRVHYEGKLSLFSYIEKKEYDIDISYTGDNLLDLAILSTTLFGSNKIEVPFLQEGENGTIMYIVGSKSEKKKLLKNYFLNQNDLLESITDPRDINQLKKFAKDYNRKLEIKNLEPHEIPDDSSILKN